jgi:phage regulator Rha-like protein
MADLVLLKNDDAFTTSLIIAEGTGNEHKSVRRIIDNYKNDFKEFGMIQFSDFKSLNSERGRPQKIYFLNEQQASLLVTYLDNTPVVRQFKKELVHQFYTMRRLLLERQTQTWQETRYQGKLTRKAETDVLKQLVEYAKTQGSQNADKLYMTYSKLANKMAGVASRDQASTMQLNNLTTIENIILHCIQLGILEDKHYKQIYQDCKQRLISYQEIAFLKEPKRLPEKSSLTAAAAKQNQNP